VTVNPWRSLQPLLLGCVIIVVVVVIIIIIILFESGNMADKHTNKRHTDRQIDSISKRKKKMQYKMCNNIQNQTGASLSANGTGRHRQTDGQ